MKKSEIEIYPVEVLEERINHLKDARKWYNKESRFPVPYRAAKRICMMWDDAKELIRNNRRNFKAKRLKKAIREVKEEYRKDAMDCTKKIKVLETTIKLLKQPRFSKMFLPKK